VQTIPSAEGKKKKGTPRNPNLQAPRNRDVLALARC